ncbi:monooxygenase family protein [Pleurocapsa sp. PCC 7319]|uniref:monooxygenase family protein n=1 Tax=Pleurocapsa sp. PCC 7319 TaxID=118161 RepID=UPI0003469D07|nr:DUF4188 domain-containing protein [Pleurocapsa sp. PCC 7319]
MNHASYQIDLPQDTNVVVFLNGIKALNLKGFFWLWQQILTAKMTSVKSVRGCVETKLSICSPKEVVIISYWQDQVSLIEFFHSPLHRRMMKNMMEIIATDQKAIAVFNETYRPLRSGRYFNEPQGLAKIYPAIAQAKAIAK